MNIETKKLYMILFLSLLYLTVSLACDPLAFRLINIFGFVTSAAFFFPVLYILLDLLTRVGGKTLTINLVFIFHFMDFVFTYMLYFTNFLPAPHEFSNLPAFNTVIFPMPRLFWGGIIGSILGGIVDVFLFSFIQKRIKSFFISSYLSTILILLAHNVPTDYFSLKTFSPMIIGRLFLEI